MIVRADSVILPGNSTYLMANWIERGFNHMVMLILSENSMLNEDKRRGDWKGREGREGLG